MNVEYIPQKSLKINAQTKKNCIKSVAISFSLLLGACAATGEKSEPIPDSSPAPAKVEKIDPQAKKKPAPSAAELMKTLKAPLVEPPSTEVKVTQDKMTPVTKVPVSDLSKKDVAKEGAITKDVVKEDIVREAAIKEEVLKKTVLETSKKPQVVTAVEPVVEKTKEVLAPKKIEPEPRPVEIETTADLNAKPFNVSANNLPFSYDIWTIREGNTPLTKGLVIVTPTWEMGKEGYMSQIWFTMMEDKIHVNSSSDIETASKGLGIRIDGGELIPFTSIAENNIGVISGKWLSRLAAANKVDIYLGFFPGKNPTSETFVSDLSLSNLARIVATYRVLNQQ
jgi:hypothetical protein